MEKERAPEITIRPTTFDDIVPLRHMHARSWNEVYPNGSEGVSPEWVKEITDSWLTEEGIAKSHEHFKDKLDNPDHFHRIAVDEAGEIVGFIHGSNIEGHQRLEGLYLDTHMQGTGLAQRMADEVMEWFDPSREVELEVADYNKRAKAFYWKYGFEEVPGTNGLFKGKIPDVKMIRKAKE